MADALVTDVQNRGPLAGLRALGRAGVRVTAAADGPEAPGLRSRYASQRVVIPSAAQDEVGFAARIGELTAASPGTVVYPGDEESIDALLDSARQLPQAVLPYPAPTILRRVRDKAGLPDLARAGGIAVPATVVRTTAGELGRSAVSPPYILKPERPGQALKSALLVHDTAHRDLLLTTLPPAEPVFVQERAVGQLMALALVLAPDGRLVARFQQRTQRTWPPEAGLSTLATSVEPDEGLVKRAAAMLSAAGYWGLANLQFIERAGVPLLIDVNPRFYGSMALAIGAGVNLPAAWHAVAEGATPPPPADYRAGVRYRWLEGDISRALRTREWSSLLPARRPCVGSAWSLVDPLPGAAAAWQAFVVRAHKRRD